MSEFSESYHLRSERAEDAGNLLRQAGIPGFVFPPTAGWVTFVADEGEFEPDPRIIAAARQPLLHYVSAEDHGWSFALFEHGNPICAYRCDWDDDVRSDVSRYSRAALERLIPNAAPAALDSMEQLLQTTDFDEVLETEPSKHFARMIGLEHYDWVAFDYVARGVQGASEEFRHVISVLP